MQTIVSAVLGTFSKQQQGAFESVLLEHFLLRRITDHQEIVKQYPKVVRAYNNFMRDYPWMTDGLMQDNCWFGDMLKNEKRKSQFKYELGRLMG